MKIAFSRKLKTSITALAVVLLLPAGYFGVYMQVQGNFHPITQGEAYRSARLDGDKLEYYVEKYNIKSIVNLLGGHPRKPWYREEVRISGEHHVKHYDISLSAIHEPTEEDAQRLVEIFKNAPRPVLIHCKGSSVSCGRDIINYCKKILPSPFPSSLRGR